MAYLVAAMRSADFLIIGGMKCGTTALHHHLARHPDIWMPEGELDFFVTDEDWARGLEWYSDCFADAPPGALLGQDSPNCTKLPLFTGVPARIKAVVPDVKLIYLVRHPVGRMRSHWIHQRAEVRVRMSAEEAFAVTDDYVHASSYGMQLQAFLEHFERDQIHVAVSEDLRRDPGGVAADVCAFLGVDPERLPPDDGERIHTSDAKWLPRPGLDALYLRATGPRVPAPVRRRMQRVLGRPGTPDAATISPALEREIVERLRPDLELLRDLVGPGFPAWGLLDAPADAVTSPDTT